MITLLHGTDQLTIAERLRDLRAEVDPSGLNTSVVERARDHLNELQSACASLGFFGTTRLVIAYDLLARPKPKRHGDASNDVDSAVQRPHPRDKKKSADTDAIAMLLAQVPESTHLILVEHSLDAEAERLISRSATNAWVERRDIPRGSALLQWLADRSAVHGARIDTAASESMLEALYPGSWQGVSRYDDSPPDPFRLDSEIAKLCAAAGDTGVVTVAHVQQLVPGADAESIWGLTNAITDADPRAAVREVERAYAHGVVPEMLLGQLTGQFESFAVLQAAGPRPDLREVARLTGISENRLRNAARSAARFPSARVAGSLDALRALDAGAKLGKVELADALPALVAALAIGDVG